MDGLTHDRVTLLSEWRNAAWKSRFQSRAAVTDYAADERPERATNPLTDAVQRQVIPKLLGQHPGSAEAPGKAQEVGVDFSEIVEFTGLVSACELAPARAKIERKLAQGMSYESLLLNILVPAARRLSDLWESDSCHYEEIAVGMLNLQQLLHDLSPAFSNERPRRLRDRRALLLSAPCEQNMLGVFMVTEFYRCVASEFFHRDGWEVWPAPPMALAQLLGVVSSQWFDLIEISATCGARLPNLAADLAQIKSASRNARVCTIVCGPAFDDHPDVFADMGADSCAHDASETIAQAEALLELRRGHR